MPSSVQVFLELLMVHHRVKHPDNFHRPADPRTESKFRVQQYMEDERNKKQTDEFMEYFNNPKFGQE
jgi:hypothetical protein